MPTPRTIGAIARDIMADWTPDKVKYSAKPYLAAMVFLANSSSRYGVDSAESIVLYFLVNASTYRTPKAKVLKAELKSHFPGMK